MIYFICNFIIITIILPIIISPLMFFKKDIHNKCLEIILYEILKIKHIIHYKHPLIKKGFILANHRSFLDFALDPYITHSTVIGRILAFVSVSFLAIIGILEKKTIIFNRNKTNSQSLLSVCKKHFNSNSLYKDRILFYPEGTRKDYKYLKNTNQIKKLLRYGLLKRIYEDKSLPIQLVLSNNKELIINEKKFIINKNLCLKTIILEPIYPEDYETFEEFIDILAKQWVHYWNKLLE